MVEGRRPRHRRSGLRGRTEELRRLLPRSQGRRRRAPRSVDGALPPGRRTGRPAHRRDLLRAAGRDPEARRQRARPGRRRERSGQDVADLHEPGLHPGQLHWQLDLRRPASARLPSPLALQDGEGDEERPRALGRDPRRGRHDPHLRSPAEPRRRDAAGSPVRYCGSRRRSPRPPRRRRTTGRAAQPGTTRHAGLATRHAKSSSV